MAQIPKGRFVKGPYKPICIGIRDCAIYYFVITVPSQQRLTNDATKTRLFCFCWVLWQWWNDSFGVCEVRNYSIYIIAFYVAFILWEFFRNCLGVGVRPWLGNHAFGSNVLGFPGSGPVGICHSDKVDKNQIWPESLKDDGRKDMVTWGFITNVINSSSLLYIL